MRVEEEIAPLSDDEALTAQLGQQGTRNREMKQATHLRLRNSMGWRCATCGQLITGVSDGWVEWLASEEDGGATILNGLRLVHRESCRYDPRTVFRKGRSVVEGLSLERFVGPDGLILLLSLLAAGELATPEVIELAKRVQFPGYELARNLVGQGNLSQVLPPLLGRECHLQAEIADLIALAMKDREVAGNVPDVKICFSISPGELASDGRREVHKPRIDESQEA